MTVRPDEYVDRALVIVAHPDDAEFWAGGTVAQWAQAGVAVTYLLLTDGDAGGFDDAVARADVPSIRRDEQHAAAGVLGVPEVRHFGWLEGNVSSTPETRRDVVRVIRQTRPQRLLTWSPEWNWRWFKTSCHIDHRTTGELALTATYPDAGNPYAHTALLEDEGLHPWSVPEIWLINGREPNHYVDITDTFDRKVTAIRAHASQTADRDQHQLVTDMRARIAGNTEAAGLPPGRLVEAFQVVYSE